MANDSIFRGCFRELIEFGSLSCSAFPKQNFVQFHAGRKVGLVDKKEEFPPTTQLSCILLFLFSISGQKPPISGKSRGAWHPHSRKVRTASSEDNS